jgi:hypothetical protein
MRTPSDARVDSIGAATSATLSPVRVQLIGQTTATSTLTPAIHPRRRLGRSVMS